MAYSLDENVLTYLCDDLGAETVAMLIEAYCTEMADMKEKIEGFEGDFSVEALGRVCHTVKSASASFGVLFLGEAAGALEEKIISDSVVEGDSVVEEAQDLLPLFDEGIKLLLEWVQRSEVGNQKSEI